jgi:hypothetical protein
MGILTIEHGATKYTPTVKRVVLNGSGGYHFVSCLQSSRFQKSLIESVRINVTFAIRNFAAIDIGKSAGKPGAKLISTKG